VVEAPGARFHKMTKSTASSTSLARTRVFRGRTASTSSPITSGVAVNLHEEVYGIRGEMVEDIWKVDARGKLQ